MVDLNINIKVPAIEQLLKYTASGIGAVAGLILAPWKASREGKAKLISAQADTNVLLTQAESEGEALKIIAKAQSEAKNQYLVTQNEEARGTVEINRHDITQRIEFQERKRLANIKSVIGDAADMLTDKKVANHEPDPDWTARFFNCAQDVSSEDMRKIWAKILAGEVERPGKTSLRTMDTLKNMTRKDAKLFEDISSFVIGNDFIFYEYDDVQHYKAISFGNMLHLQDCGLVNAAPLVRMLRWRESMTSVVTYQCNALEIARGLNAEEVLKIPDVMLTTAGKELFSVVRGTDIVQMEYLQDFSRFLQSRNCQLFYLKDTETLPDGQFKYRERIKIEPKSNQPAGSAK